MQDELFEHIYSVFTKEHWINFDAKKFRKGLNLTVRRGVKHSHLRAGDLIYSDDRGSAIVHCVKIKRFKDINLDEIKLEHDPKLRKGPALGHAMKTYYQNFDQDEIVTLIFFTFHEKGQDDD